MLSASTTAAQILAESLHVSQTKTEWELVYIQVTPTKKELGDGVYSYIIYSVSTLEPLHCEAKIIKINTVQILFLSSKDHLETPTNPLCGEPNFAQRLPCLAGCLQLRPASPDLRPLSLQDDAHPGLHRFPAAHE